MNLKVSIFFAVYACHFSLKAQDLTPLTPVEAAIKFLKISPDSVSKSFSVSKKAPYLENTTIYSILTIKEEGDGYAVFNNNILIVENNNNLLYLLRENNSIYTDAVRLTDVTIDTAPYMVKESNRAFALRLSYSSSSSVNPFNSTTINFYEISDGLLRNILNEFVIAQGSGENNGRDSGEWKEQESILIVGNTKSNGYNDITVKTREHKRTYTNEEESESTSEYQTRGFLWFNRELASYVFKEKKYNSR